MSQTSSSANPVSTPLARALDQSESVQQTVEQSANELLVLNAVLKQELPTEVQAGEVAQALRKTDDLENRIHEAAEDLAQVNEVLAQEIDQREDLERELVKTKAALASAKAQTSQH